MEYGAGAAAGGRAGDADWVPPTAVVAGFAATPRDRNLPSSPRHALPACPELDCIRHLLPPGLIAAAELRAAEVGVGADRALIAADIISEEAYLAAFTAAHSIAFETLDDFPRAACRVPDNQLINAPAVGILPVNIDGNLHFVVAPWALGTRGLIRELQSGTDLSERFRVTTTERLQKFVTRHGAQAITRRANNLLHEIRPECSARSCKLRPILALALISLFMLALISATSSVSTVCSFVLCSIFLAWSCARIVIPLAAGAPIHPRLDLRDDELPVYSVIVALYQEATAVKDLVTALRNLDYPKEKLEIIFALEAGDRETRARLEAMRSIAPCKIVIAPPGTPRTKPRALNAALPFARGTFVAVYDAEDRPEPDQLRRALDAFSTGGTELACVQARLTIDNTADGWLASGIMAQTPQAA